MLKRYVDIVLAMELLMRNLIDVLNVGIDLHSSEHDDVFEADIFKLL